LDYKKAVTRGQRFGFFRLFLDFFVDIILVYIEDTGVIAMSNVTLELEDDLVSLLHQSNQPAEQRAKELIVLELYREGTISSGKAGELLGISRWEFIHNASRVGIPYYEMTEDEWKAERERRQGL
jgi:predicted HTH domain antitoxin